MFRVIRFAETLLDNAEEFLCFWLLKAVCRPVKVPEITFSRDFLG